ncbi:MAG: Xaa-Pro peptidase family protein [Desulfonauticus sp.]|nr:Xaa-Pro peptidase family protein [Desulfonauticus sp.]
MKINKLSNMRILRVKKVQNFIQQNNLDCFLVLNPTNRYYLSGFELKDVQYNESSGFLVITKDNLFLFTDNRYLTSALELIDKNNIFIYHSDKFKYVIDILKKKNIKSIGFEYNFFPYEFYFNLKKDFNLIGFQNVIESLRKIKDDFEIQRLRDSNSLVYKVFEILPKYFKVGQTEREIAWFIEKYFREHGASEVSFPPIVAFGENSAKPHAVPSNRRLKQDELILVDIGCRLNDYCSDQTRTFWFGKNPSDIFLHTLELVKEAQKKAIDFIKAGEKLKDAYFLVKNFFKENGVENNFPHALGHGIGLDTHEPPGIGRNDDVFEEGMVITIEPGLYDQKWGGIRWEYMGLVTKNGLQII